MQNVANVPLEASSSLSEIASLQHLHLGGLCLFAICWWRVKTLLLKLNMFCDKKFGGSNKCKMLRRQFWMPIGTHSYLVAF